MGDLTSIIGTALQTAVILGSVGAFVFRLHLDLKLLIQQHMQSVHRISKVESRVDDLSKILIDIAKQDSRQNHFEARLQELSNRLHDHVRKEA